MNTTELSGIFKLWMLPAVVFTTLYVLPPMVAAQSAVTGQVGQQQTMERQQLFNARFAALLTQARVQHAQIEKWHKTRASRSSAKAKSALLKERPRMAKQSQRDTERH